MNRTATRKEYEQHLNRALEGEPHPLGRKTPPRKPGSWLRRNDPIQFEVGYNEYTGANT